MKRKINSLIGLLSIAIVLLTSGVAMATITYKFNGYIIMVTNVAGSDAFTAFDGIAVNDPFTYGLIVDETVADSDTSDTYGVYNNAITAMYLDIHGQRYLEANRGNITVVNNGPYGGGTIDAFQPYIDNASYFTLNNLGANVQSSQVNLWEWKITDEPTALTSDALPLFALNPDVFPYHHHFNVHLTATVDLGNGYQEEYLYLEGKITEMVFSASVPEPGILILLGISMVSIAGLRRFWK